MSASKNNFRTILTVCILAVILVIAVYIVFFFNKMTIQGDSMEKLTELMGMNFADVEITDIQYKYVKDEALGLWRTRTQIFVFLNESGELESKDYYFDSNGGEIYDQNMEYIPHGHIAELKEIGIELHQIQKHGGKYNQIRSGFSIVPYEIHWYRIDKSYDGKSNIVLFASVPRKVSIYVDKIIQENNKAQGAI